MTAIAGSGARPGSAAVVLHHAAQSRSFRVLWMLHEIGQPFTLQRHSFAGRALRDPAFLAISPAGRVPALQIDGQVLFESAAILEYLAETRAPALTRPPGHAKRGAFLEWLHYGETIAQHLAQLTFQHVVLRPDQRSRTVAKLETLRLGRVLDGLDRRLEGREHLLDGFTAADVMCAASLMIACRFVPLTPRLADYLSRQTARPACTAALAQDGPAELYLQDFYPLPPA